uniref:Uncharacterized protein n=1 Tax=Siphoviridae sp. ctWhx86 TaxID=2826362 RepID=A0A8S5QQF2_9CAUD|nr:MAG TPA: hypothetical protein [Siphoviridae sp. ctWhx86]
MLLIQIKLNMVRIKIRIYLLIPMRLYKEVLWHIMRC